MSKFAVIKTGGKQYKVAEGDQLRVEKINQGDKGNEGGRMIFDQVLLVADGQTGEARVGTPLVSGARVEAKVVENGRAKKVRVVKYKSKTRYKRVLGHRQAFTKVEITKIT